MVYDSVIMLTTPLPSMILKKVILVLFLLYLSVFVIQDGQ
jgi:hypothetical protein